MISAIVLAAGQSKRMGRAKMTLPWRATTVLGRVIEVFHAANIDDILVVTGADREATERIAQASRARAVFNPDFASDDMLTSLQIGLRALPDGVEAAFIALGDQPQIEPGTVASVLRQYSDTHAPLIVPSYHMHRGHPWLVARLLWDEILSMRSPQTPRDFLERHATDIRYVVVETPTVLQDLDTPDDYRAANAGS